MGWYDSYYADIQSDLELITTVQREPILLSPSLRSESFHLTIFTLAIITVLHLILLAICRSITKSEGNKLAIKNSHQATNLFVNLFLGMYGMYTWLNAVPGLSTITANQKIIGFHEFIPFSAAQLGYNLWSLPMGFWIIGESKEKIGHHVAVISVSLTCCFMTWGYRYYCPFMFGCYELSSVPLAIMNVFKNSEESAKQHYPTPFIISKVSFAVLFLTFRVILGTPQVYDLLRISTILCYTCESYFSKFAVSAFCICAYFLMVLQFSWGLLVVKGIYRLLKGDTKKVN